MAMAMAMDPRVRGGGADHCGRPCRARVPRRRERQPLDGPPLAYAQYDLVRRVHFALELTLHAITRVFDEGPRGRSRRRDILIAHLLPPRALPE
jgi:hypothetical protein